MKRDAILQFATLCYSIFASGWNYGTLGSLLPRLQAVYHVGYTSVSLKFMISCLVIVVASISMMVGYCLEAAANAGTNAFLASLSVGKASTRMGILHASYGLGAMTVPLVAAQFSGLPRWSFVYFTHLGIASSAALLQSAIFRFRTQEHCWQDCGQPPPEQDSDGWLARYKKVFRLRAVHLMAHFSFIYGGHEVTVGGWIVTYIIKQRHGGHSAGYISSGYFGGLMLGRIALLPVSKFVGERRVVFVYICSVIGLELIVWLVPNLFSGAVCVSFVGFFLWTIFPILMNYAGRVLPPDCNAIGWVGSWASVGAAVFPFLTGAIASKAGIGALQPVLIAMISLLFIIWIIVPGKREHLV
ncbi:MFS general substrate transporter [Dichomitus squalens]|uniref:MFS general substrate transporter n=1 Tax=Dichomitus squalens TaxID=114155 RepID=A0A4Q9PXX8_9APHY|nr:MFS general substrate transporter [Dichomitus squalens]TBU59521.1 MFS general substrate transporter [Dichomitus squalens]